MTAAWEPWGREAFERAGREMKPVLVLFSAHSGLAEALPRAALEKCVPVFADHRDRPDLARRYDISRGLLLLGHDFAALAEIDVHGQNPARALETALAAFRPPAWGAAPAEPAAPAWGGAVGFSEPAALAEGAPAAHVAELVRGKGTLDFWALELLLHAAGEWGDAAAGRLASAQLERWRSAEWGDDVWSLATFARLLSDGAALLESAPLKEAAARAGSALLAAWSPGRPIERRHLARETRAYGDANAFAALALMRWARLGHDEALAAAIDLLSLLEKNFYDPVLGVLHRRSADGASLMYGLLDDNAWTAYALTEAYLMTGRKDFRDLADAIVKFMFQQLWDRDLGAFADRMPQKDDLPPLRRRVRPVHENAVAMEALWRLHHMKGNANYKKWLDWGLRSLLAAAKPAERAPLLRVQDLLQRGRRDLELVGKLDDPRSRALLGALNALHLPRKIVSFVDPDDQDYILAHRLEPPSYPRLFVCAADSRRIADTADPGAVAGVIEASR